MKRRQIVLLPLLALAIVLVGKTVMADAGSTVPLPRSVYPEISLRQAKAVELLRHSVILDAVRESNRARLNISPEEIKRLDENWRESKTTDDLVKRHITNPCAVALADFQDANDGFQEIFATDAIGLNVCQTNKTSDYYQADEEWWTKSFLNGKGAPVVGDIEYDESARSESVSLSLPIMDGAVAIGVAKFVIDITSLRPHSK